MLPISGSVRENAIWYVSSFPHNVISNLGHANVSKTVLAGDFDAVRATVCSELRCKDTGCLEAHEMTPELRGLTETSAWSCKYGMC